MQQEDGAVHSQVTPCYGCKHCRRLVALLRGVDSFPALSINLYKCSSAVASLLSVHDNEWSGRRLTRHPSLSIAVIFSLSAFDASYRKGVAVIVIGPDGFLIGLIG